MNDKLAEAPGREIQLFEPPRNAVYTIEATAQLLDVPRRRILRYYRHKLISSVVDPIRDGFYFDQRGIRRLRRIEELRPLCRETLGSIRIILDLTDEIERLQIESLSPRHSANGNSKSESSTTRRKNDDISQ
jgi:DNA-binding transcriptional MerR regulator